MPDEQELIKEIVIERLKSLPEDIGISIGSEGNFKKSELISSVELGNELGKKIIEVEMSFLRGLKEGILYEQ
jgi:hypothetical protein